MQKTRWDDRILSDSMIPPPTSIQQSILITTNLGTPTGLIPVPSEADSLQVPTRINHII